MTSPPFRVLIIEDNPDDRAEVRRMLLVGSEHRYKFEEATTGAAGVAAITASPPDCVILDFNLPDMDAVELLESIKGKDGLPVCPVMVLTGSAGREKGAAVLRAGAQDYLGKGWMTAESMVRALENTTERFRMTLDKRQSEQDLEEERRRTAHYQDVLRQSQKMEAIGRLAGGIAHDFNNLMLIVLGNVEQLDEMRPDHPKHEIALDIQDAGERAARLTRQLLAFARKQRLNPTEFTLDGIVEEMSNMLQRVIGRHIKLVVDAQCPDCTVRADASQIEQVVMNLVFNARDALPQGGTITLRTEAVTVDASHVASHAGARAGPHAVLTVADSGHGMTADVMSNIFEPFFTTKPFGQGAGLGLATVDGIVSQSGGWIETESAVGRGTTFRVYLPRV